MAEQPERNLRTDRMTGPVSRVVSGTLSAKVEDARQKVLKATQEIESLLTEPIIDNGLRASLTHIKSKLGEQEAALAATHARIRERFGPSVDDWAREMDELLV